MKPALIPLLRRAVGGLLLCMGLVCLRCDPLNESCERVGECQLGDGAPGGAPAVGGGGTGGDTQAATAGENNESGGNSPE